MKIWSGIYKGLDAFFIENENIKLAVLRNLGAKIASLIYKPQGFEVASQPEKGEYRLAKFGDLFELYDVSGFDDCFPTIDKSCNMVDHGELWSREWDIKVAKNSLTCSIDGAMFPYRFERAIEIDENSIILNYSVENFGKSPLLALWAFHGLVNADEETRIILPHVDKVINVHKSNRLGDIGTVHSFPEIILKDGTPVRLDKFDPKAKRTEKYYAYGRLKKGEGALTLNHGKLFYRLNFPEDIVPYLGIWIDEGGLREEGAVALETTTAFYDSPDIAEKNGCIEAIGPGKTLSWTLKITLEPLKYTL